MPVVSVIMPVYNAAATVREALHSVLRQTLRDIEVLALDDASHDESLQVLRSVADPRIRVVSNGSNLGVARTLNRGIEEARGEFLARLDADDIAMPARLEQQCAVLRARAGLGALGASMTIMSTAMRGTLRAATGPETVRALLVFDNPIHHPTVMLRREILLRHALRYRPEASRTEDYDLWTRLAGVAQLDNVRRSLVRFRVHAESVTASHADEMRRQVERLQHPLLSRLGIEPTPAQAVAHAAIGHGDPVGSRRDLETAGAWLSRVRAANASHGAYSAGGLDAALDFVWRRLCLNSIGLGPAIARDFHAWSPVPTRAGRASAFSVQLALRACLRRARARRDGGRA